MLADLDESLKFRVILTKEEKKYVDIEDTVTLKLGNSGKTVQAQVAFLRKVKACREAMRLLFTFPKVSEQ